MIAAASRPAVSLSRQKTNSFTVLCLFRKKDKAASEVPANDRRLCRFHASLSPVSIFSMLAWCYDTRTMAEEKARKMRVNV
jgi:hypothetical protein